MIERLYPDECIKKIYDINFDALKEKNIRGIIFDIDNTLVRAYDPEPEEKIVEWIKSIRQKGFEVTLVSNNTRSRVQRFNQKIGAHTVHQAVKPRRRGYLAAAKLMKLRLEEIAMVGDQIFTDVYGGNRLDMYTILVAPYSMSEFPLVKLKRLLEAVVLRSYRRNVSNASVLENRKRWKEKSGRKKLG